jgi:hypothetical protein
VILESHPPHRLAYTWHTITPEWAAAVGMDEATAAAWRAEARSKVERKTLEKLTCTYLGQDWVERQRADMRDEVAGAEARLSAALNLQNKLELILDGEAPYDIYVGLKEPHEQAIGWESDLNDGVRLNIRPFVKAGGLRSEFNIHGGKDRN